MTICGLTLWTFILGVAWPAAATVVALIYAILDRYEGQEVEKCCGEGFEDWYHTF